MITNTVETQNPVHIISLGAGVQSSTMALMAAHGEIRPMPSCAIFADTQDEPSEVYAWLAWLKSKLPFPVETVSAGKLSDSALDVRLSKKSGNTYTKTGLPVFTLETRVIDESDDEQELLIQTETILTREVEVKGMGMRQCTRSFKIDPIRAALRRFKSQGVVQWIGISRDEAHRMKPSRDKWIKNIWPLVDAKMTREGCLHWMELYGYPKPPRSACAYCPYHDDTEWLRLKSEQPEAFNEAVEFERNLQAAYKSATALRSIPFLHRSRVNLSEVIFSPKEAEPNQFGNECEGMCGV